MKLKDKGEGGDQNHERSLKIDKMQSGTKEKKCIPCREKNVNVMEMEMGETKTKASTTTTTTTNSDCSQHYILGLTLSFQQPNAVGTIIILLPFPRIGNVQGH